MKGRTDRRKARKKTQQKRKANIMKERKKGKLNGKRKKNIAKERRKARKMEWKNEGEDGQKKGRDGGKTKALCSILSDVDAIWGMQRMAWKVETDSTTTLASTVSAQKCVP